MKKLVFVAALLALAGCTIEKNPNGQALYTANCAACHGSKGYGDGAFANQLQLMPADLSALSENAGGEFPVDYVLAKVDGYSISEHFTGAMPRFGRIVTGDGVSSITPDGVVSLTQKELQALAAYIETLQGT